ncbi:9409_t:CDS:2 [Funneliformis geosporum]|nr:9409_t:CDS:2 [Funneliformis geosporum]
MKYQQLILLIDLYVKELHFISNKTNKAFKSSSSKSRLFTHEDNTEISNHYNNEPETSDLLIQQNMEQINQENTLKLHGIEVITYVKPRKCAKEYTNHQNLAVETSFKKRIHYLKK